MSKHELTYVLETLVRTLDSLSDDEYNDLLKGEGKLVFQGRTKRNIPPNENKNDAGYVDVIERLKQVVNRAEGLNILDQEVKLKKDLVGLAKQIPVYVAKSDTKDRVKDKIIEALVGTKLTREAIDRVKLK